MRPSVDVLTPLSKEEANSEPFYQLVANAEATPRQQEVRKPTFPPENKDQVIPAVDVANCEMVCKAMYYFQGFLNAYILYHQE